MKDAKLDQVKGRVKQAVGDLTDNDKLQREGKNDEMAGKAKGRLDTAADKLRGVVDGAKDKANRRQG